MLHYFTGNMTIVDPEPGHRIAWQQRGPDDFAVRYGKEVHAELTYGEACSKLGQALLHQLACAGAIDNSCMDEAPE